MWEKEKITVNDRLQRASRPVTNIQEFESKHVQYLPSGLFPTDYVWAILAESTAPLS